VEISPGKESEKIEIGSSSGPADVDSAETSTDDLDAVTDKRLTGPGARAAKVRAEPKTDVNTLGREKRSR
jgi:hypothetical protein